MVFPSVTFGLLMPDSNALNEKPVLFRFTEDGGVAAAGLAGLAAALFLPLSPEWPELARKRVDMDVLLAVNYALQHPPPGSRPIPDHVLATVSWRLLFLACALKGPAWEAAKVYAQPSRSTPRRCMASRLSTP